jgi:hypothetical protein
MAFTGGIKRPQMGSNQNQTEQKAFDRLVTVIGYNLETRTVNVEDKNGKKYEVFINKDAYLRGEEAAKNLTVDPKNWMGHRIDKYLEKAYPTGSKIILQRTKVLKKDNGQGFAVTEAQRIAGVPNPEIDKTFQGTFTFTSRLDENRLERISRVQYWQPKGIDINEEETLMKLKKEMDESVSHYGEKIGDFKVTYPSIGVQFRAVMKTDKVYQLDNTPIYEVVDTSIPFDWIPGPQDENGKEIKTQAHPMTGDEMLDFAERYAEHIANHPAFKDHIDDMKVEVCAYRSYPASNNKQLQLTYGDPRKDENAMRNPLYQLSHRLSFVDMDQSEKIQGRNFAVNGIIQISPNKLDKVNGKPVEIPSYWVNNVHVNGITGHIHAIIRTSEGYKTEPHENLKLLKDQNTNTHQASDSHQSPQEDHSSHREEEQQEKVSQPMSQSTSSHDDEQDFDPFETSTNESTQVETPTPRLPRFGKK